MRDQPRTLPARAKKTGNHRLSIELDDESAELLEMYRRRFGLRSWGESVRHLLRTVTQRKRA